MAASCPEGAVLVSTHREGHCDGPDGGFGSRALLATIEAKRRGWSSSATSTRRGACASEVDGTPCQPRAERTGSRSRSRAEKAARVQSEGRSAPERCWRP